MAIKEIVSRDGSGFSNILGAPLIFITQKVYFSRLMRVYVGLMMLAAYFLSFPLITSGG